MLQRVDCELDEIYELLLKSLDDKQDSIRIEMCKGLVAFFKAVKAGWKMESYEKIVRTLFVHYDDPKPDVRKAVEEVLVVAASIHKKEFLEIVMCLFM